MGGGYSGADDKRYNRTFMIAADDIIPKHPNSIGKHNTEWREALVPNTCHLSIGLSREKCWEGQRIRHVGIKF